MDLNWTSANTRSTARPRALAPSSAVRQADGTRLAGAINGEPSGRLVLSVAETAEALGISDDLVYELLHRGELPCLHFGRRKVIPRRAIDLVIRAAMTGFDPAAILATLSAPGLDGD